MTEKKVQLCLVKKGSRLWLGSPLQWREVDEEGKRENKTAWVHSKQLSLSLNNLYQSVSLLKDSCSEVCLFRKSKLNKVCSFTFSLFSFPDSVTFFVFALIPSWFGVYQFDFGDGFSSLAAWLVDSINTMIWLYRVTVSFQHSKPAYIGFGRDFEPWDQQILTH